MRAGVIAVAASGLLITGCAGTSRLLGNRTSTAVPKPKTQAGRSYLQELSAEQANLARAERAIPKQARTPAALSRSIALLAGAIGTLAKGLSAIHPPGAVAGLHARLVGIVRTYFRRLAAAARNARTRAGELNAANALATATHSATSEFTATFSEITARLAK
jgi:hypothetical protein